MCSSSMNKKKEYRTEGMKQRYETEYETGYETEDIKQKV